MAKGVAEANLGGDEPPGLGELERTLETLREESEIAHALLGLSSALGDLRTVRDTLEKTVRIVAEVFGADRCFAASWDADARRFTVTARAGFDDAGAALLDRLAERGRLPLLQEAQVERLPVMVEDAARDGRMSEQERAERSLGAYIGIPLARWGQDFGGLGIEWAQPRSFGPKDEALARGVARQVGVVLSNARRYNLLNDLRSSSLLVGSRLRLADVTSEVARAATALLKGDRATVFFADATRQVLLPARSPNRNAAPPPLDRIDLADPVWAPLAAAGSVVVEDEGSGRVEAVGATVPAPDFALLGAIVVSFDPPGRVQPDELEALRVLAVQAGSAIENAQRFERQRQVARSLQQGLVSTEMPRMPGCELGAVYEAASTEADIGGDFFDAFELPSGHVAIVVGDVSGKGAEAAAQTAMAKYMLRAFAMQHEAPSEVLFHLNEALVQGFGEDRFTTALYAVLDRENRSILLSAAGHPPPFVYRKARGIVESLDIEGPLLGAFGDQSYDEQRISLEPGDVMVAFTDGLIEARSESDLYGNKRVEESIVRHASLAGSATGLARAVYEDARSFGTITDDAVVFVIACRHEE